MNKTTAFNHKKKEKIIYIMGGKCCVCGYNRLNAALEMHHINMREKEFSFSNYNHYKSIEEMKPEMMKCALVCSVCHKEIHYGDFGIEVSLTFNIDRYNEVIKEIQNRKANIKTIQHSCAECGKPIGYRASLCSECSAKRNRVVTRPTRNELKGMIRNMPFTKIAEIYNVSDKAISKWCLTYKLPSKKRDIINFSDDEWEGV